MAFSWLTAGAMCFAMFYYYDDIRPLVSATFGIAPPAIGDATRTADRAVGETSAKRGGSVELRAGASGHFETTAYINGRPVEVLVDTGATLVALTYEDAERLGIFLGPGDFTHRVNTANGSARVAPVNIGQIEIDDITVRDIKGIVSERGRLNQTLLGMAFLNRLSRAEMRKGLLILEQ